MTAPLTQDQELLLNSIYYQFGKSGGYSSLHGLFRAVRQRQPLTTITRDQVEIYLNHQETYSLHRKKYIKAPRNMVYTPRINFQWSTDLGELRSYKEYNEGVGFFLLTVDTLSRFVYTEPVKQKTAKATSEALERIFKRCHELPHVINSDSGKEFVNKSVSALLKRHKIHFFRSYGDIKASHAESAVKTIKYLLHRYFDKMMTREWVSQLQAVTDTYNKTYNTGIKMTPEMALTFPYNINLSAAVLNRVNKNVRGRKLPYLKSDDVVRIALNVPHKKGFEMNWSRALYIIDAGPYYTVGAQYPMYLLRELNGEKILGGFLPKFLLKVNKRIFLDEFVFPIDKVIKKGPKNSLVRFLGYSDRDNMWLPNSSIDPEFFKKAKK